MDYTIEKGIPLPRHIGRQPQPCPYPFGAMEIGDSFVVVVGKDEKLKPVQQSLGAWARRFRERTQPGFRISTQFADGKVRVWRTADVETRAYTRRSGAQRSPAPKPDPAPASAPNPASAAKVAKVERQPRREADEAKLPPATGNSYAYINGKKTLIAPPSP